jgi:hypothetical protein
MTYSIYSMQEPAPIGPYYTTMRVWRIDDTDLRLSYSMESGPWPKAKYSVKRMGQTLGERASLVDIDHLADWLGHMALLPEEAVVIARAKVLGMLSLTLEYDW